MISAVDRTPALVQEITGLSRAEVDMRSGKHVKLFVGNQLIAVASQNRPGSWRWERNQRASIRQRWREIRDLAEESQ